MTTNQDSPNTAGAAEPVAWMYNAVGFEGQCAVRRFRWDHVPDGWTETPLYAHPPENPSQRPSADDEEEAYKLGKEDGYSEAVQWIDERTGGDGEYFASTIPGHGCPGPVEMRERIVERFNALSRPSAVPDEVVEAAAKALARLPDSSWDDYDWEDLPSGVRDSFLEQASAALTASLPAIRAQAVAEIAADIRATMCDCSGKFIADELEQGAHDNTN